MTADTKKKIIAMMYLIVAVPVWSLVCTLPYGTTAELEQLKKTEMRRTQTTEDMFLVAKGEILEGLAILHSDVSRGVYCTDHARRVEKAEEDKAPTQLALQIAETEKSIARTLARLNSKKGDEHGDVAYLYREVARLKVVVLSRDNLQRDVYALKKKVETDYTKPLPLTEIDGAKLYREIAKLKADKLPGRMEMDINTLRAQFKTLSIAMGHIVDNQTEIDGLKKEIKRLVWWTNWHRGQMDSLKEILGQNIGSIDLDKKLKEYEDYGGSSAFSGSATARSRDKEKRSTKKYH